VSSRRRRGPGRRGQPGERGRDARGGAQLPRGAEGNVGGRRDQHQHPVQRPPGHAPRAAPPLGTLKAVLETPRGRSTPPQGLAPLGTARRPDFRAPRPAPPSPPPGRPNGLPRPPRRRRDSPSVPVVHSLSPASAPDPQEERRCQQDRSPADGSAEQWRHCSCWLWPHGWRSPPHRRSPRRPSRPPRLRRRPSSFRSPRASGS
jgi:hypothetical protein